MIRSLGFFGLPGSPDPKPVVVKVKKEKKPKGSGNTGSRGRTPLDPKELRRSQLRCLEALTAAGANVSGGIQAAVTLEEIAKRAKTTPGFIRQGLGSVKPEDREKHDQSWGYKSLLSRGMVKQLSDERGRVYHLTALGERTAESETEKLAAIKTTKPNTSGRENPTSPVHKARKKRRVAVV